MRFSLFLSLLLLVLLSPLQTSAQTTISGTATIGVGASPTISVAITPPAITIANNSTQTFIVMISNDAIAAGANLTLTCTGVCGSLSKSFVHNNDTVVYTSPNTPNTNITLQAVSVAAPSVFANALITVTGTTPPAIVNFISQPQSQEANTANDYPITPTVGNSIIVPIAMSTANVISTVQACPFTLTGCITLTQACPSVGACAGSTTPGGQSLQYYGVNLPPNLAFIVISNSSPSGTLDIAALDVSGLGSLDVAAIASNQNTPTTTPTGPSLTPTNTGELIVGNISTTGTVTGMNGGSSPYIFGSMTAGDAFAYYVNSAIAPTAPSYASSSGTWSGFQAAYNLGTTPVIVRVNLAPTSANVQVNATQTFIPTVTNDNTNAGVSVALSGGSCSGATCGTLSSSTVASGTSFTYTAPAVVPGASVSRIQHVSNVIGGPSGNLSLTATGSSHAVCGIAIWNTASGTLTVSDTAAQTYTSVITGTQSGVSGALACKANSASGVTSLSFAVAGSTPTQMEVYGLEYAGIALSSPVDQTISASGFVSPMDSGLMSATTNATDVLIGFGFNGSSLTFTAGTDGQGHTYTLLDQRSTIGSAVEDFFPTSTTATYKATLLPATAAGSRMFVAALKASAAGSSAVTLTATSVADGSKSATAAITIGATAVLGVSVSPTGASTLAGGSTVSITPTVTNDPPAGGVTWVLTGVGALSTTSGPSGTPVIYTPPATVSSTQTVTVTATAVDDGTKSATTTITVSQTGNTFHCSGAGCPAFPTAQGAGAAAKGGRGGVVYNVTSLADNTNASCTPLNPDNVTCTLRDCLTKSGARTCIFRVSGTTTNASRLSITNPFITIAGQTVPGSGFVMGGPGQSGEAIQVATHDVVIRYLTWSGNAGCVTATVGGTGPYCDFSKATGPSAGTVGLEVNNCGNIGTSTECKDIIFDHTTMRWAGNKGWLDINNGHPSTNVTYQWGLGMEPNAAHPVITEPDSTCFGCTVLGHGPVDFHHNLVANFDHRWILYNLCCSIMQNNISFNGLQLSGDSFTVSIWGGLFLDLIGNKFLDGPQSSHNMWTVIYQTNPNSGADPADCSNGTTGCDNTRQAKLFFLSNIAHPTNQTGTAPVALTTTPNDTNQKGMCQVVNRAETPSAGSLGACDTASPGVFVSAPTQTRAFPITQENVANLDNVILPTVGNSQHLDCLGNFVNNRDSESNRVVQQYINRGPGTPFAALTSDPEGVSYSIRYNGLLDTSKKDVVWTTGTPTEPPKVIGTVCTETLHDGIPDVWKSHYGLSTSDVTLYQTVDPATGLTYLEDYLDGLVP